MIFWFITSIRLSADAALPNNSIQDLQTAIALAQHGHSIVVWVKGLEGDWKKRIQDEFGDLPRAIHFLRYTKAAAFSAIVRALIIAPPPDALISRLQDAIIQFRRTRLLSPHRKLILEYDIPKWLESWRSWRSRNPHAGFDEQKNALKEFKKDELQILAACNGILVSPAAAHWFGKQSSHNVLTDVFAPGCSTVDEDPPEFDCQFDLGYIGELNPGSGVHILLKSLKSMPPTTLLIVGAGPREYLAQLKSMASELNTHSIQFIECVPVLRRREIMQSCRIGVVPTSARHGAESRNYGSTATLVEWFAARVPVVASSVPCITKSIDNSQLRLVQPDNPEELASVCKELLNDPIECERLRRNAVFAAQLSSFSNRAARIEAFTRRLYENRILNSP